MKTASFRRLIISPLLTLGIVIGALQLLPATVVGAEDEVPRSEKLAPKGGTRGGLVGNQTIFVLVNGKDVGQFTGADLVGLSSTAAFSPRGQRKSWTVVEVLKSFDVTSGKTIHFYDTKNKEISLPWEELIRQKNKVNLSYNFRKELILSTDVSDRLPEEVKRTDLRDEETEGRRREEMHKQRQRSLIFFRDVKKIDVIQ